MKQEIITPNADSVPGVLSQAIESNGFIFVSGQIPITVEGVMIGDTTEQKLAQIMKNISAILSAAGLTLNNIVKVTIYVTDLEQMADINSFYPSYFEAPYPARESICVNALPLASTIEISVIASR